MDIPEHGCSMRQAFKKKRRKAGLEKRKEEKKKKRKHYGHSSVHDILLLPILGINLPP